MRRLALLALSLAALAAAPVAAADTVTRADDAGRSIVFDVRTPEVDVDWHAGILRGLAHGDEIARVTVRIVAPDDLRLICGSGAAGCYSGRTAGSGTITVPAGESESQRHTLIHEYGHHLDAWRGVGAASREPNGSAGWWAARDVSRLLDEGAVSHTYSLGWDRAIGEIFAEDYVALHLAGAYRIRWIGAPDETVLAALRSDLENAPVAPAPPAEPRGPLVLERSGRLRPGRAAGIPFGLLGPGRRVTYTATIRPERRSARRAPVAARIELRCTGARPVTRVLTAARRSATIDVANLGPADCRVTLRSTSRALLGFTARLRLAVEPAGAARR